MSWNRKAPQIAIAVLAISAAAIGCNWTVIDGVGGGPDAGSTACGQGGAEQVPGPGAGGAQLDSSAGGGGAVQTAGGTRGGCGGAGGVGGQGGASADEGP